MLLTIFYDSFNKVETSTHVAHKLKGIQITNSFVLGNGELLYVTIVYWKIEEKS